MMKTLRILINILIVVITIPLINSCSEKKLEELSKEKRNFRKAITLVIQNYCLEASKQRENIFLINMNYEIGEGGAILTDFDTDGIPDKNDTTAAVYIDYDTSDTNGDGYSDLIIFLSGLTREQQDHLFPCEDKLQDTDLDGLTDCEERITRTDALDFDSDDDGVPDYLEVRNRMEPRTSGDHDAKLDLDMDGITNIEEIKLNTPTMESNTISIKELEVNYKTSRLLARTDLECYDYTISNISILSIPGFVDANQFRLYLIEKQSNNTSIRDLNVFSFAVSSEIQDESTIIVDYSLLGSTTYFEGTGKE